MLPIKYFSIRNRSLFYNHLLKFSDMPKSSYCPGAPAQHQPFWKASSTLLVHSRTRCLLTNLITSGLCSKNSCSPPPTTSYIKKSKPLDLGHKTLSSTGSSWLSPGSQPTTWHLNGFTHRGLTVPSPRTTYQTSTGPSTPSWNTTVKLQITQPLPSTKHTCIYQEDTSTLKHLI